MGDVTIQSNLVNISRDQYKIMQTTNVLPGLAGTFHSKSLQNVRHKA